MKAEQTNTHKRVGIISLTATALLMSNFLFPTWADSSSNPKNETITSIQLTADGAITAVNSGNQTLDPNQVAHNLPVIIITSYTHNGKTVSDPTQFTGVKGTIRIDISIQNQTGKLETLNANINGQQRSKQKLIYTPLSVAASVTLDNTKPSQIKKPGADATALTTNGIVGTTTAGHPSIQWAEINGINDKHTSKFTLVYETEDFKPPVFDIVVQPGFGINFDIEQQTAETKLIVETLSIFNDAEKVLDDSGEALGKARLILNEAGSQIGSKTISDLEASNRRVADNAKRVVATLNDVEAQATRRFEETGSNNLRQLLETTAVVRSLLGDPESAAPKLNIDPTTCVLTEAANTTTSPQLDSETDQASTANNRETTEIPSVMQVIHGLSARLNVLSETSQACKTQLLNEVNTFIGPKDANETTCANQNSLSCIDWRYRETLKTYWQTSDTKNTEVLKALQTTADSTPKTALETLTETLKTVGEKSAALNAVLTLTDLKDQTTQLQTKLEEEIATLTAIDAELQKQTAAAQQLLAADKQPQQLKNLLKEICLSAPAANPGVPDAGASTPAPGASTPATDPVSPGAPTVPGKPAAPGTPAGPGTATSPGDTPGPGTPGDPGATVEPPQPEIKTEKANQLAQLIWGKNCPANEEELNTGLATATAESLYGTNAAHTADLNQTLTNLNGTDATTVHSQIATHLAKLNEMKTAAEQLQAAVETQQTRLNEAYATLASGLTQTQEHFETIVIEVEKLDENLKTFKAELEKHLTDTKASINALAAENQQQLQTGIDSTRNKFEAATKQLFTQFSEELESEAASLTADGRLVINHTLGRLGEANQAQAERIAAQTSQDIENIQNVTGNGIKETDVVSQLLAEDIKRVLFDIGTNENRGTGLLGAVATSNAHLTLADNKMVDSTKQLELSKNNHRAAQADEIFAEAALRATLARLENSHHFPQADSNQPSLGWFSFHLTANRNQK